MNQAIKIPTKITPAEYLAGEQHSPIRHEFINGEIYAMAGESKAHNTIALNLALQLRQHLRNKPPCRVFIENIKTWIKTADEERYYYPDLQVSCNTSSLQEHYETAPCVIIEILSPSTERYDRADKFYAYRKLPNLQEYVLIAQDTARVEVYRRSTQWELEIYTDMTAAVYLESIELEIAIAMIYEGIVLES
jgi:Uma2 family endonuclease